MQLRQTRLVEPGELHDPRWARALFFSTWAGWLWLAVRLYMAYVYLPSGWAKVTGGKWLFGDGSPILGLVGPATTDAATPTWYASFLDSVVVPNAGLFATLVAFGELAVGVALLLGLLTGFAAFGAVFLSSNFVLAGVLGSNPILIMLGTLLVVAWRNAGWIGVDRWLLSWGHRRFAPASEPRPVTT